MAKVTKSADVLNNEAVTLETPVTPETPVTEPAPEPTSEKMEALKVQESDLLDKVFAAGKTPEGKKLMLELWKVQQSMENEKTEIAKNLLELANIEKRNARIALFDNAVDLAIVARTHPHLSIPAEDRTEEQKNELQVAYDAAKTARETVTNELLVGYKGSTRSTVTGTTGATATGAKRGSIKEQIIAIIAPLYANNVPGSEVRRIVIKDNGFNDGTANGIIKAYETENGIK